MILYGNAHLFSHLEEYFLLVILNHEGILHFTAESENVNEESNIDYEELDKLRKTIEFLNNSHHIEIAKIEASKERLLKRKHY